MATVLTSQGVTWIRDALTGTSVTGAITGDYIGWGLGAGTAAKADLALFAESSTGLSLSGENRVLAARSVSGSDVLTWVGTLTANSAKTITNAGTFSYSASSLSGNYQMIMPIKGDFTGIPLSQNDRIQFTINLQIS